MAWRGVVEPREVCPVRTCTVSLSPSLSLFSFSFAGARDKGETPLPARVCAPPTVAERHIKSANSNKGTITAFRSSQTRRKLRANIGTPDDKAEVYASWKSEAPAMELIWYSTKEHVDVLSPREGARFRGIWRLQRPVTEKRKRCMEWGVTPLPGVKRSWRERLPKRSQAKTCRPVRYPSTQSLALREKRAQRLGAEAGCPLRTATSGEVLSPVERKSGAYGP